LSISLTEMKMTQISGKLALMVIFFISTQYLQAVTATKPKRQRRTEGLFPNSKYVKDFSAEEFEDSVMKTLDAWIVDFYAPWCGHCQHFAPKWTETAKNLADKPRIHVGAVNCVQERDICSKMGIKAYPTLKAFHFPTIKESYEKTGSQFKHRDPADIKRFVLNNLIGETSKEISLVPADKAVTQKAERSPDGNKEESYQKAWAAARGTMFGGVSSEASCDLWLYDIASSIQHLLKNAIFAGRTTLSASESDALKQWIHLLMETFPGKNNQDSLQKLYETVASGALWNNALWDTYLDTWELGEFPSYGKVNDPNGWPACSLILDTDRFGPLYVCGLWTLLHMMTLAPYSATAPVVEKTMVTEGIHKYIYHFFECEDCRSHFLASWEDCSFGRCEISETKETNKDLALWMWRLHNDVNQRVAERKGVPTKEIGRVLWPSQKACNTCRTLDPQDLSIEWNEDKVYNTLQKMYRCPDWDVGNSTTFYQITGLISLFLLALCCIVNLVYGQIKKKEKQNPYKMMGLM